MTSDRRAALIAFGVLIIIGTYGAAIFIPVAGGCAVDYVAVCRIEPWATVVPISLLLATVIGVGAIAFGAFGRR